MFNLEKALMVLAFYFAIQLAKYPDPPVIKILIKIRTKINLNL